MMNLLVFLVIIFGLFGVISTQYIGQYREAYYNWVKEAVYNNEVYSEKRKRDICSKVESFSREFCEINDLLIVIIYMLSFTLTIVIFTAMIELYYLNFNIFLIPELLKTLTIDEKLHLSKIIAVLIFSSMIFCSIPIIKHLLKMSESTSIDRKLFNLWWDCKCPRLKISNENKQPRRLYQLLDENIKLGNISDYTSEEKELVKDLSNRKDVNMNP